jgi:hypothetical protein
MKLLLFLAALVFAVQATPIIVAALGAIGLLFAPLGAYFVAKRQFSGRVETTDAKELWAEARSLRKQAFDRIAELNRLVEHQQKHIELQDERIEHLEEMNLKLRERVG